MTVALQFATCEPCWPWPKFKAAGDTRRSTKRGIALENYKLSSAALSSLTSVTAWGYIWDRSPDTTSKGGPPLTTWDAAGVRFMPMVWGSPDVSRAETTNDIPSNRDALLGFNEPNYPEQANLTPAQAAALWPRLQALATRAGIKTIVSPAMAFGSTDPVKWLTQFFQACQGCQVDAVAIHSYTCYGRYLKEHIDKFRVFKKPLWLTEFTCADPATPERLNVTGQMAYMKEAIPLLEQDPDIQMYAWFSYFENEWAFPILNGKNGDSGLVYPNGTLSDLGKFYGTFASTAPEGVAVLPPCGQDPAPATTAATIVTTRATTLPTSTTAAPASTAPSTTRPAPITTAATTSSTTRATTAATTTQPATTTTTRTTARTTTTTTTSTTTTRATTMPTTTTTTTTTTTATARSPSTTTTTTTTRATTTPTTTTVSTTKVASSTSSSSAVATTASSSACRTAVVGERCYTSVTWAMQTGIYSNPSWYPASLTPSSSFEDFQAYFYANGVDSKACTTAPCLRTTTTTAAAVPLAQLCGSTGCSSVGVNIFGADGFANVTVMRAAIQALVSRGVRHFRVTNVGAWQDAVLSAINDAAGTAGAGRTVSVQITSLFFDSPATCSALPSWMDFSLATTASKLRALRNVGRILVQLDTCSICQSSSLYCMNPTEQAFSQDSSAVSSATATRFRSFLIDTSAAGYGRGHIQAAHAALPANVEFVIPYQSSVQSPRDLVSSLVQSYISPIRAQGRKVHLEGTAYPFWTSTEQAFAPFPTSQVTGFISDAISQGFDGFVVAETGWPQACPTSQATRPASLANMCSYVGSTLEEAERLAQTSRQNSRGDLMTYIWKLGPLDAGDGCGAKSWGLFDQSGSFVCSGQLASWR